jgi:hypothetical protein
MSEDFFDAVATSSEQKIEEREAAERETAKAKPEQVLQFLIAEQTALQTMRSDAAAITNARLNVYLFAVVGAIIALAFVAQINGVGRFSAAASAPSISSNATPSVAAPIPGITAANPAVSPNAPAASNAAGNTGVFNPASAFFWFGLTLLPALFFLGLTVFLRALQTAMEDVILSRGMARIRHFYGEIAPEIRERFVLPLHDDDFSLLKNVTITRSRLQSFSSAAGSVAVINSLLLGAWLAILLAFVFAPPAWLAAILGAFLFLVALAAHQFYKSRRWEDFEAHLDPPRFPADNK